MLGGPIDPIENFYDMLNETGESLGDAAYEAVGSPDDVLDKVEAAVDEAEQKVDHMIDSFEDGLNANLNKVGDIIFEDKKDAAA